MKQQLELRYRNTWMVCIAEWPKYLKRSMRVSLKGNPTIKWTIENVYAIPREATIERTWRVGGL